MKVQKLIVEKVDGKYYVDGDLVEFIPKRKDPPSKNIGTLNTLPKPSKINYLDYMG